MYALFPLKIKKVITITNAAKIFLDESSRKRNKICVDNGSEKNHFCITLI